LLAEIEKEKPVITTLLRVFSNIARPKEKAVAKNSNTSTKDSKTPAKDSKTLSKSQKLLRRDECDIAVDNIYTHMAAVRTALEKIDRDVTAIQRYYDEIRAINRRISAESNAQWEPNPDRRKLIIDLLSSFFALSSSLLFLPAVNII